jgi:hypothetical protein
MAVPYAGMAIGAGLGVVAGLNKNKQLRQQRRMIVENFNSDISALKSQFQLSRENSFYDKQASNMESKKAIADSTINAASSGIGGISIGEVFSNIKIQSDFKDRIRNRNLELLSQNLDTEASNKFSTMQANIASLKSQKLSNFDLIMGGIQGGVEGASTQQSIQESFK